MRGSCCLPGAASAEAWHRWQYLAVNTAADLECIYSIHATTAEPKHTRTPCQTPLLFLLQYLIEMSAPSVLIPALSGLETQGSRLYVWHTVAVKLHEASCMKRHAQPVLPRKGSLTRMQLKIMQDLTANVCPSLISHKTCTNGWITQYTKLFHSHGCSTTRNACVCIQRHHTRPRSRF